MDCFLLHSNIFLDARASPSSVIHPEPEKFERGLEGRLVRDPHGHVEIVQEDDELLAAEGAELVLGPLFHCLFYRRL